MNTSKLDVEFQENKIDAIFEGINQCHLPGAAVGIAINGRPVYRKGFGLANMELPVALSPSIRLRIGSTSKHFTCLAYLLLCEEGRAGIDDCVEKYFPELHPVTRRVTMRQLMGNTSGIRDVYEVFAQFNESYSTYGGPAQAVTASDLLPLYESIDDVNVEPDTTWIYNNAGWLLLSRAIEKITGQTLEAVLWERIFRPLGMYDSLLLRRDTEFICNRGSQHVTNPAGGFERLYWGVDSHFGAGAIISTVDDMLRWMAHMEAPTVGGSETWSLMKTPHILSNGTSTGYGMGLFIDRYRGIETIHHPGSALGGSAQMLKVPAAKLDVVVLVNRQDVLSTDLTDRILDVCLPELAPLIDAGRTPSATGTFCSPTSGQVIQLFCQDGRQMASVGGISMPLARDASGVWWCVSARAEGKQSVTLVGDCEQPQAIYFNDFGRRDELLRQVAPENPDGRPIVGRYRSEPISTTATITVTETQTELRTEGRFGSTVYKLECLAKGIWKATPAVASRVVYLGGILSFQPDGRKFQYSNFQMRFLPFRRCE